MFTIIDNQSASNSGSDCLDHNELNTSFTSDLMTQSCEFDASYHIYNELQYATQQPQPQRPPHQPFNTQQSACQQQSANLQPSSNAIPIQTGIIYGFRTRHLSCIEENDSDSLHSTSVPQALEMLKNVDECFKQLVVDADDSTNSTTMNSMLLQGMDDDGIAMIDETRLYDLEYFDELSVSKTAAADTTLDVSYTSQNSEEYWQSTTSDPVHVVQMSHIYKQPDIMTTSCYGALNSSFDSECSALPPAYMSTSTPTKQKSKGGASSDKVEALYATPEKRREQNRSFDSQTSSIYGGTVGGGDGAGNVIELGNGNVGGLPNDSIYSFSMTSGVSVNEMLQQMSLPMELAMMDLNGGGVDGKENPAEELSEEMAAKCLNAAQNGKLMKCILVHEKVQF